MLPYGASEGLKLDITRTEIGEDEESIEMREEGEDEDKGEDTPMLESGA